MEKTKSVKNLITFLLVTHALIGLSTSMYSRSKKKFYVHYFLLVWCMIVAILFGIFYIGRLYDDLLSGELDFTNPVKLYYYMKILGAAVNFLCQLINCKDTVDFFNEIQVFETLDYFDINVKLIKSAVRLVTLKISLLPIIIEITLIVKRLHDNFDGYKRILQTFFVLYPLIITNIIPNCLFGILVLSRLCTLALNRQLNRLEKEANFLQNKKQIPLHTNFYRMHKLCYLADKLDELAEKYALICSQILKYASLSSIPVLASLLCNLYGVTLGLFRQYFALADTLINEESYDVFNAITSGIYLLISFEEIASLSLAANQSIEALKETGLILKRIKLSNTDIRFRQAVENFSLKILVTNVKIQPMKLINIDLGLLHDVLSAVTSFLLILIQSDLSLRFSLK